MDPTALFNLTYGLYIIGAKTPAGFGGSVVDALGQITSDNPPQIMVCCMKKNYTPELLLREKEFTISILPENINPFFIANFGFQSARDADKWANVPHSIKNGLPTLDGAIAYLHCQVIADKELSTHRMFFAEVTDAWNGVAATPLTFGNYQKNMKNAAYAAFQEFKNGGKIPAPAKPQWQCSVCGYIHEGEISFAQLPAEWVCPTCGVGKDKFVCLSPAPAAALAAAANSPVKIAAASGGGKKWQCRTCGYIYEGEIPFEDLPADWVCPTCGVGKEAFDCLG